MTIPVFPSLAGQEWPLARTPLWKTLKQESLSGKEVRVPAFTFPRYQWSTSFSLLRAAASLEEFQSLLGFVNSVAGGALPFYFEDPQDNAVSGQEFGTGDGATTVFQLVRAFAGFVEPVQSLNGTPAIAISGTPTSSFSLSNVGVVTFASAPASGAALTWTGSYYWLCRLDEDTNAFSQFMSGLFEMKKLSFTSIKL
jgi:uncharacterized protein (TIGR02217 family)